MRPLLVKIKQFSLLHFASKILLLTTHAFQKLYPFTSKMGIICMDITNDNVAMVLSHNAMV